MYRVLITALLHKLLFFGKGNYSKYSMMEPALRPLVVGVSGVTNGGKTTLTEKLLKCLPKSTMLIKQDDYFYPVDSPHHIPSPGGLQHHNWEVISSIDMDKMVARVKEAGERVPPIDGYAANSRDTLALESDESEHRKPFALKYRPVVLLDGFILYDDERIRDICDLKFFLTLSKDVCKTRRLQRNYVPPDPPGYFEVCVWPMYEEHLERIKQFPDIVFMDGDQDFGHIINQVFDEMLNYQDSLLIS